MKNTLIVERWLRRILPFVIIGIVVWLAVQGRYGAAKHREGDRAPAVSVDLSDGSRLDLADAPGEVTVVNFWASWCGPCRAEAPELSRLSDHLKAQGTGRVVGLAVDQGSPAEAKKAADTLGMRYPVGPASGDVASQFGVQVLPTTFVVGPDGKIVKSFVGAILASDVESGMP